jgi:hypothetical protein
MTTTATLLFDPLKGLGEAINSHEASLNQLLENCPSIRYLKQELLSNNIVRIGFGETLSIQVSAYQDVMDHTKKTNNTKKPITVQNNIGDEIAFLLMLNLHSKQEQWEQVTCNITQDEQVFELISSQVSFTFYFFHSDH